MRKQRVEESPWTALQAKGLDWLADELSSRVVGQPVATETVATGLVHAVVEIGFEDSTASTRRPRATFLFAGPTGVGKTETAKALAKSVFGREDRLVRFDMAEFQSDVSFTRLVGSPPGSVGYAEGGQPTEALKRQPCAVLLFDEVEKAHPRLFDLFLHIIDDGRATDGRGNTVDFSQSLVIFTSNLGSSTVFADGMVPSYATLEHRIQREIERVFVDELNRPELYGRLAPKVVVFDLLRPDVLPALVGVLLNRLSDNARERFGVTLRFDADEVAEMTVRHAPEGSYRYGGRAIRSVLEVHLLGPFKRWLLDHPSAHGTELFITWTPEGVTFSPGGRDVVLMPGPR